MDYAQQILSQNISNYLSIITSNYKNDLRDLGRESVQYAVSYSVTQLPYPINYLLMKYYGYSEEHIETFKKDKKSVYIPSWLVEAFSPLYNPILTGAQEELDKVYKKTTPLIGIIALIILGTSFGIGYYVGRITKK